MACNDWMEDNTDWAMVRDLEEARRRCELLKSRLDHVTRLLCTAIQLGGNIESNAEIMAWWDDHRKWDEIRKEGTE